MNSYFRS